MTREDRGHFSPYVDSNPIEGTCIFQAEATERLPTWGLSGMFDLHERLSYAATRLPAQVYLWHKKEAVGYSQLREALGDLRSHCLPLAGRRVVLLLPDSLTAALLNVECFLQGATITPLSPFSPNAHVEYVLSTLKPHIVFTNEILHAKFRDTLRRCVCLIVNEGLGVPFQLTANQLPTDELREAGRAPVRAVFFTSGTTGKPKGVCLSEQNLLSAACINSTILRLDSSRRSLITVPLYDYYGMLQLYSHLLSGAGCIIGESGQFPKSAINAMRDHCTTDIVLVPFTLKSLLDFVGRSDAPRYRDVWQEIRCIASSSDVLTRALLSQTFALNEGVSIFNVYGLTEAGRATYREIRANSDRLNSIGRPSHSMEVFVDAPLGSAGEIVVRGPTVMLGYLQEIVDDRIRFTQVTEIRTGDDGYVGEDGEIRLLGRKDDLVSLHGVKIHLSEIEAPVLDLPGVMDTAAWLCKEELGGHKIFLDVVAEEDVVSEPMIRGCLRSRLPRMFLPHKINFVDRIKRTEIGGKIVRKRQ